MIFKKKGGGAATCSQLAPNCGPHVCGSASHWEEQNRLPTPELHHLLFLFSLSSANVVFYVR